MREFRVFVRHVFWLLHFIRGVLVVLVLILAGCAVVIAVAEPLPLADAVYFVLITGLTVGYGDIVPATAAARIASVVAGLIGVITAGLMVAVSTRALARAAREVHGLDEGQL